MPYDIQLPDGTLVDNIPDDIDPVAAKAKILQAYPELALGEKRTLGQVGKDVLAGVGSGIGSLAQFPGQVYGLVTGDMDQSGLQQLGRNLQTYSEEAKSPVLKAKESSRSQKIAQTEGILNQAGVAIMETLKDPALLSSFVFEQAPQLAGTMGGGYLTKQGVKVLMRNATEEVLAKSGVRGAVGTGALMQGADIGTETYERIFNERMMQGYPEEQARQEALAGGRQAAVEAAAISGLTSFGAGSTIERALTRGAAAGPKRGIIRGTLGEVLSESVEEGGGKLASNIEFQKVKPESDIFEGVGAAIGMGALGGGLFGLPSSILNTADANQIERAKAQVEEAKRKAQEENKPQEVLLQVGYDPNVEGTVINTPIIVNPDGTTTFPSERNKFAQVVPNELSEAGMYEKYGIRTPEQVKEQTFTPETIRAFGISPKANIYKNKDILNADLADPKQADKVKGALEEYLKKYPKANPEIRSKIINYLLRQEFHRLPESEVPTQTTESSITPQADQAAIQQRLSEGFKNRPEIKKIYDDYNKRMQEGDADKAALSAFNSIVTPQVIKSFGIPANSSIYGDQELINADLSNPETADRIRAKLMDIQKQTKSPKIKENIDKYLNRSEFITPSYVDQYLNPPREAGEENLDHFVFVNNEGEIESKYGTIVEKGGKRYAKYPDNKFQKGGDRELNENVLVNPKSPDQIELMTLYKARDKLMKEPDDFKSWLIGKGVDPKERSDISIESRLPHKMFRDGGYPLDDLVLMAIEEGILHEPDFQEGIGGVESMRRYIKMAVDGQFVPTSNNMRNMNDLENLQQHIENLENIIKGTPEEAIAQEFRGEEIPTPTPPAAPITEIADQDKKALENIKKDMVRFASGMSGLRDLISGSYWRAGHKNYGVGFDVGLLSKNAIDQMAHYIVNLDTQVFIDSGAFSNFRKTLRGQEVGPLDFDKILEKYNSILYAIAEESENQGEKVDYPRPMLVMPDIVGDQKASIDLIEKHKDYIASENYSNLAQPIIPLQKGELTLSEAYDKILNILKSNNRDLNIKENKLIFGIPSNAEAVSRNDLIEFLRISKPARIHFLGAAADSKLNPLLQIVAHISPETKVTADASKVRSAILTGVAEGKTRDEAIKDALYQEDDPGVMLDLLGPSENPATGTLKSEEVNKTDTKSSEFKKWFEGSKVVNKDGSPRVMYHGTNQDISKFFKNQFFAYRAKDANTYAFKDFYGNDRVPNEESEDIEGANVTPVYINAKKIATPDDVMNLVKKMGIYNERELDSFLYTSAYDESYEKRANLVITELKKQGFDAIQHYDYDLRGERINSLQVFEPNQIKSIYNKKPTKAEGILESKEENKAYTNKAFNLSKEDQRLEKEISGKTFQEMSDWSVKNAPNQFAKVIANMVNKRIKDLAKRGIKLDFVLHSGGERDPRMYDNKGHVRFDYTANKLASITFNLNGAAVTDNQRGYPSGMNYTTILHELLHVATSGQLFMRSSKDPLVVELSNLRNQVVKYYNDRVDKKDLTPFMKRINNGEINALRNIDELVSWGLTDKDMQTFLSEIKVGEKTAFSKLVELVREILGINKDYESALDRLVKTAESVLSEDINVIGDRIVSRGYSFGQKVTDEEAPSGQGTLLQKEMRASFEGVDEAYAEAIRKQFTQEEATVGQKFNNLKSNFFEKMVTGVFDEFRAIKKYTTEGYMMARLSKSIDGGLQGLLEHGQVYIKDGALDIRPNTKGLLEILEPLGAEVDQYQIWKALSRDAQMMADKRSFDASLVAGRDKLIKGTINGKSRKEVYEKARLEENQLNKSVLDVALQSGLIDKQAYQVFSNDINYIPFYKMMEDGDVDSVNASSKLTGQYFSKALKGGEKKTNDLMENVLLNWSHILSASMKNQAAVKTIEAAESMGAASKAKPMDGKYPPNTIKVMEEGKIVHYTLEDPDLVDAISTISYLGPKSAFLNVAKGFTNALRYGITLSPAYKIRNLIRDSLQSAAISELGPNMFDNVYNGLRMTRKGDPTFMSALAGGGIFEMGTAHEGDQAKLIKRLIDKGVREATILDTPEKIKAKLQDLLDSYNELGNKFENANRLALYKKLIDSGKSHLEASYASRDLMDFSMQGQFRAVKVIGSVVPFFNARLQGLYKLGRDGITPTYRVICNATTGAELRIGDKEKAQRFMVMSSAIAMASILLYGAYKDDEDFQRREGWDRDNFWWFKIGDTQFRIPKPFEIGAFGTIAERTYEQIVDDSVEGKVFGERLNHILMDTFSLNPMPQMIKPLIDLYANKDSFTSAPIESAGMERLSKQERLTNKTSGVAIALGGVTEGAAKILTFNPDAQGFSPVQMDYAIKAYLGWLGATAVSTADLAVEPFTEGTRVRPPVIDTLAMGFIKTEPQTQSKYMTQFYENNARLQSALADMRHYAEQGDMDKVTKILEEKGDDIALSKVYDKATKQLAELRKQSRRIEQMKDIPTDDKRAEMNRIKILMSDIAKEMEGIRKSR